MKEKENKIYFQDEDGEQIELTILEQTTLAGKNYLLVLDETEDVVMIMVETELEDDFVSYEFVEDEEELKVIAGIFNELADDIEVSL